MIMVFDLYFIVINSENYRLFRWEFNSSNLSDIDWVIIVIYEENIYFNCVSTN